MAITAQQRSIALQAIVAAAVAESPGDLPVVLPLADLLPGVTPAQVLDALLTLIGSNQDANFTTALSNMVAALDKQVTQSQEATTALQAQVATITVA